MKQKKKSKKKAPGLPTMSPDHTHLSCSHHKAILASLALIEGLCSPVSDGNGLKELLVVGLGGGALPNYLHRYIPNVS